MSVLPTKNRPDDPTPEWYRCGKVCVREWWPLRMLTKTITVYSKKTTEIIKIQIKRNLQKLSLKPEMQNMQQQSNL